MCIGIFTYLCVVFQNKDVKRILIKTTKLLI